MAVVWIPAILRDLTGGMAQVSVAGASVREVIENLEERYPGVKARLVEDERLRPNITLIVDGVTSQKRLRERVAEGSEIHFLPAISGGSHEVNAHPASGWDSNGKLRQCPRC
jgi:molybdopterin synthase sulfur carrier subunit